MKEHLARAVQRTPGERLGRREYDRLCERLLAYTEAKALIKELVPNRDLQKRAISLLYARTGGNPWVSPQQVRGIIEEARA
jgi:hypothetical protein